MEKLNRQGVCEADLFEKMWDKLDEIVQWINDRRELRCSECGLLTLESELKENYMNCPNCGHKMK